MNWRPLFINTNEHLGEKMHAQGLSVESQSSYKTVAQLDTNI